MLTISIAMATYNGAKYLREQLDSLAHQTLLPHELVVSDDGSTDETLDIVRDFAAAAPFAVRILDKTERLGFADNFLHAAEACVGDLIAFCDQDDVWLPEKLETQHRRITQDGSLLAMHTLQVTDEALQPTGIFHQGIGGDLKRLPLEIDTYRIGWGNSMLFHRIVATTFPRQDRPLQMQSDGRPLSHDTWLYTIAATLGSISHISQPLILYRQHQANVFGVNIDKSISRKIKDRFNTWMIVPTHELSERRKFYMHMARLFGDLARRADHPLRQAASTAYNRFSEYEDYVQARLTVFDSPRLAERLRAFRRYKTPPGHHVRRKTGRLREVVLGVTGLGRLYSRHVA